MFVCFLMFIRSAVSFVTGGLRIDLQEQIRSFYADMDCNATKYNGARGELFYEYNLYTTSWLIKGMNADSCLPPMYDHNNAIA